MFGSVASQDRTRLSLGVVEVGVVVLKSLHAKRRRETHRVSGRLHQQLSPQGSDCTDGKVNYVARMEGTLPTRDRRET